MSLSDLLHKLKAPVQLSATAMPLPRKGFKLFFSVCDPKERAIVITAEGETIEQAWESGAKKTRQKISREKLKPLWLKVDWVEEVKTYTWSSFRQELRSHKRNYYRFGLALDDQLEYSFLEQELNGNATLYLGGKTSHADLNEKNFTRFAEQRYGKKAPLNFDDTTPVYRLRHQGIFCGVDEDPQLLYGVSRNAGRRVIEPLDTDNVTRMIETSSDYLAGQVKKSGRFNYGWFPCFDRSINTYNTLRHASSTYAMLEGWEVTQDEKLKSAIKRSLAYLNDELIKTYTLPDGDEAAFLTDLNDEIKLGGNAVCILAFSKYTELMQDEQYLPLMEKLALGIRYMQNPEDGSFVHVLNSTDLSTKDDFRTIYYEGEAAFGLMRLYGITKDPRWLAVVEKAFDHFIADDYWKAHDHWLSYCVNELTLYKPEARYFQFGIQNVADHLDFVQERITTFPTLLELMMAAHKMIGRLKTLDEHKHLLDQLDLEKFDQALRHRAQYLMNGYFWPEYAMYFKNPQKIVGSCYIRHHAFRVRIDDVEHYLSGYVAYLHYYLGHYYPGQKPDTPQPPEQTEAFTEPAEQTPPQRPEASPVQPAASATETPVLANDDPANPLSPRLRLKQLDFRQLWRFFIDGRFHKKYNGWVGYEGGERGSIQALLNAFEFMLENFDLSRGLKATYIRELHKLCMLGVETSNKKSSPGDIRFLNAGMPFFAKSTTFEHLEEVFQLRRGDGTVMFNTAKYAKTADQLDVKQVYEGLLKDTRINYRNWYPNLTQEETEALEGQHSLTRFYEVKHKVQLQMIEKMEAIIERYNAGIVKAKTRAEKLKVITLVSREMELLHPFPDGNSRTFSCILQSQLLMFNGFLPPILENPNLDNEVSHAQWIEEVEQGMARTEQLLANPEQAFFDYSINDMPKQDQQQFLAMAAKVIERIQSYEEAWLNPARLQQLTGGLWHRVDYRQRFTGVGDHNTLRSGQVYCMLSLEEWKKDGLDLADKISNLQQKGIQALVTDDADIIGLTDLPVLLVDNIRQQYTHLAVQTRQQLNPQTVLVTGTEGKTGFKTQLHHILQPLAKSHANINSANTEIPVLRSLINLKADDQIEINEVSVGNDEALRLERTQWVNPDICVITHISPNHMDLHKTVENIIWAKSSVITGIRSGGLCLINRDMPYFEALKADLYKRRTDFTLLTFGSSDDDDAQLLARDFDSDKLGWQVKARIQDQVLDYFIPLLQAHTPLASLATLLTVKCLGLDPKLAANAYASLKPYETMGRMLKLKQPQGDVLFYDQSRRGAIGGMRSAFEDLSRLKPKGKVVALVGGISTKRDSDWTKEAHAELAEMINHSPIDRLYTTGNYMGYVQEQLDQPSVFVQHSDDLDLLAEQLTAQLEAGDLLFIIGSAYLYLGRVTDRILKKLPYETFSADKPLLNKSDLLYRFFCDSRDWLCQEQGLTDVTDQFAKAFNREKCHAWFYNGTPQAKEKARQVFGSFFDFGSADYLLHIDCATVNMHIGLIAVERDGESLKQRPMTENEFETIKEKTGQLLPKLQYRSWGGRWASIDIGKMTDLENKEKQTLLTGFAEGELNKNVLQPLLTAVRAPL